MALAKDADDAAREKAAAVAASDQERLLPGEDPGTDRLDDAVHWRDVYQELVNFKEGMVAQTREAVHEAFRKEASREIASTDLVTLEAEFRRFTHRLSFWSRRVGELRREQEKRKKRP